MAKKPKESVKRNSPIELFAYLAMVFAAIVFVINIIVGKVGGHFGSVVWIMTLIKDLSILLALGLGGWSYSHKHGVIAKSIFALAMIVYIICIVLGIPGILK